MENKLNNEKNHNLLENKQKIFYNNLDIYLKYENEYQSKKNLDDLDSL